MNKEEFVKWLDKLGIVFTEDKLKKLEEYYNLLITWNEMINLTAITEKEAVYLKHFYDSLTLARDVDFNKDISICDVGSGAGFPGIVLKIVFPNIKITLVDSLNKRVTFLNEVIKKLELSDIEAVHARMEDYSVNNEEKFDVITSRAVASIPFISEISVRSLKTGGIFALMKGKPEEDSESAYKKLGLSLIKKDEFKLPIENSDRCIVVLKKTSKTDKIYPRNITKIQKFPL